MANSIFPEWDKRVVWEQRNHQDEFEIVKARLHTFLGVFSMKDREREVHNLRQMAHSQMSWRFADEFIGHLLVLREDLDQYLMPPNENPIDEFIILLYPFALAASS